MDSLWASFQPVLQQILVLAVTAILAWAVKQGGDYLAARTAVHRQEAWYRTALMLVDAAEQALPDDANDAKYDFARAGLKTVFPSLTEIQIKALVESAVKSMNDELKYWGSTGNPPPVIGVAQAETVQVTNAAPAGLPKS